MFTGKHLHTIDDNNRLAIPSSIRKCVDEEKEGKGFFITPGLDKCLAIYPPLHFKEIANNICTLGIDKKPAHVQTVHNELIKDGRFVLVGRGVYALREHGYEPGTVREVITRLLKERGPLDSTEVVRLVNQKRFLKENTILLNLQNRRHFKRLEDGRYGAEEA